MASLGKNTQPPFFSGADSFRFKRRIDPGDLPTLLIPQLLATSFQTNFSDGAFLVSNLQNSSRLEEAKRREDSPFQTNFSIDPSVNEVETKLVKKKSTSESAITQSHFQTTFSSAKSPEKMTTPMTKNPSEVTNEAASVSAMATNNDDSLVFVTPLPRLPTPLPSLLEVPLPPTDQLQP